MILQNGKLVYGKWESRVIRFAPFVMWIFFAVQLVSAVESGQTGHILVSAGMLTVMTTAVSCSPVLNIVDAKVGSSAHRVVVGMLVFGFMIAATGCFVLLGTLIH
jgi:hypothetical protein